MMNLVFACLAGGVVSLVVGAIWYNPKVFGKAWMQETGVTEEDAAKANMGLIFGLAFVVTAYMTYEMKWINHPDENLAQIWHGMYHGVKNVGVFGIGAIIVNALFEHKSFKYIGINAGYWLVVFAIIGAVVASFPSFKDKAPEEEESTETSDEATGSLYQQPIYDDSFDCYRFS